MARAARRGTSTACGASITRTDRWPPPSACARILRSQLPRGFAMKTTVLLLGKVSKAARLSHRSHLPSSWQSPFARSILNMYSQFRYSQITQTSSATTARPRRLPPPTLSAGVTSRNTAASSSPSTCATCRNTRGSAAPRAPVPPHLINHACKRSCNFILPS